MVAYLALHISYLVLQRIKGTGNSPEAQKIQEISQWVGLVEFL